MAGAGDPDNRRPMDWNTAGYSEGQQLLLSRLRRLTEIRAAHPPLRYGTRSTLEATQDTFSYVMELQVGDPALDGRVKFENLNDWGVQAVAGLTYAFTDRLLLGLVYRI